MQGKTINGFTLQEKIGKGGMAEVWLAETSIGKKAAVKLLLIRFCGDESIVARFENEAKVMVPLDHPNIRQVYDFNHIDGRPCIVMEYLEGDDLKALIKSGRHFTDEELRRWWDQIADALNYTHAKGIVHRDIKPSNIFLDKKGNIKLLDFGIAKVKESISMTQTGTMMGTLMYMSPEQVKDSKHIGPETDVYSLAVTFVHLLTGKAPYNCDSSDDYTIRKGIVELPLDLSSLPADWRDFLAPYLNKDPRKRPALRPFEAVSPIDPEATVVDSAAQSNPNTPPSSEGSIEPSLTSSKEGTADIPQSTEKPKKSKTGLWIAFVASLLIAAFGEDDVRRFGIAATAVLLFFILKPQKKWTDSDTPDTAQPLSEKDGHDVDGVCPENPDAPAEQDKDLEETIAENQ